MKNKNIFWVTVVSLILVFCLLPTKSNSQHMVVLGEQVTNFRVWGEWVNRARNIRRAARSFNNFVLQPGQTFSYNRIIGQRTIERGYLMAHVILNGELVDGLGGGICQVSGTIHAAALKAGLEIVEHHPHSRRSTYIDPGWDATVDYGRLDLRMRNPYPFPLQFTVVEDSSGVLHARILGREIPYDVEVLTNITSSWRVRTVRIENPNLPIGTRNIIDRGSEGITMVRTRRFSSRNSGVYPERPQESLEITYNPAARVIELGTAPVVEQEGSSI